MPSKPYCRDCHHPAHTRGDCGVEDCGCVRYVPVDLAAREARKRLWVADVAFFVRNRWVKATVRVKAQSHQGAALHAVREAKKLALKPRTRVQQVRMVLTPAGR